MTRLPSSRRSILRALLLEDRITPVTVTGLSSNLSGGTILGGATSLQVSFSAPVLGAATATNFELRGAGVDGRFGTGDDLLPAVNPTYSANTTTVNFAALPASSTAVAWRLTVRDMITDTLNIPLDGDGNGNPGGNYIRDFVAGPTPFVNLIGPGGRAFDVQAGGFGAGQLINGSSDAFDGVNRLKVGAVDFQPTTTTVTGTETAVATVSGSQTVPADATFHDTAYTLAFTSDGSPVQATAVFQVFNLAATVANSGYRLVLDGTPVGVTRSIDVNAGYYSQVALEEVLVGLSPGIHTLKIQAIAVQPVRVDQGTLSAFVLRSIPLVGPGTEAMAMTVGGTQTVPADAAFHDTAYNLTITSDGSPVHVTALLQVFNLGATVANSAYRLTLDGTPVGVVQQIDVDAGYYAQVALEGVLTGLSPGAHTLKVQAMATAQALRVDQGTLSAFLLHTIPSVGPGTEAVITTVGGTQTVPADAAFHDTAYSLTIISDGSPVQVSALFQVFNLAATVANSGYRLVLDGNQVGDARYIDVNAGYYSQFGLEKVLFGLSPGPHTFKVQAIAAQTLRVDQGTLAAFQFHPFPNPTLANSGRIVVTSQQVFTGLVVNREITVPSTGTQDFARTVEVITNPTASTITTPVQLIGNLGSTPTVFATQNGNLAVEPTDQWVGTDDGDGTGAPAIVHYIHGPGGLIPATVAVVGDQISWTFNVTVNPGQTLRLATYTILGTTRAAAIAAAQTLVGPTGFGGQAAAFLTPAQLQTVINFDFPPVPPPNTPTISDIPNQPATANGAVIGPISFTVGDTETPAAALTLSATSSNPALVPVGNVSFGGSGAGRTVTVAPVAGQTGTATITVTVTDGGGLTATDTFVVTVNAGAANTPPTISDITNKTTTTGVAVGPVTFTVNDAETPVGSLTVAGTSSNTTLIPNANIVFGGSGGSRTITVIPAAGQTGTATITVTVTDASGLTLTATDTFNVTINPPPPPPVTIGTRVLIGFPQFAVGSGAGTVGTARLYNPDRTERFVATPFGGFTGGVRTAAADFNGDGVAELVVGTGPGRSTRVIVLDGKDQHELFAVDPFEAAFTGGVFVAAGDVNGDGLADLAISPDEGGGPRVRVFSGAGFGQIADFFGIEDTAFRGGARAALGDLNGDGFADLIVAAGFGGGPRVAAFSGKSLGSSTPVKLFGDFLAFEPELRNGTFVAAGDGDGDGFAELIAGGGPGGGPRVSVFRGANLLANVQTRSADFFAGDVTNRGGIRVAVKDLDGDALSDLVVGAGPGAGSRVTAYYGRTISSTGTPPIAFEFDAVPGFSGGVFVG